MVAAQSPGTPAPPVVVAEVTQRTVPIYEEFVARTQAMHTVELRARVEGFLEQVRFREGGLVQKGQILFVIEQPPYEAALQSARAQLVQAQADLTRAQEQVDVLRARAELARQRAALAKARQDVARFRPLARDKAVPQQDLDTAIANEQVAAAEVQAAEAALKNTELQQRIGIRLAQAAVESAQAAVSQAELHLAYTTIQAPIDGLIGFLAVDQGNLVGPNQQPVLATMSTIDPIEATFGVSELQYLSFVRRTGAVTSDRPAKVPIELILADGSVHPHQGQVVAIDRALDPQTGTITVQARFPNPDKLLRPGQFGRVRIRVRELADALLVPQLAVQDMQGTQTVLVVDRDNTVALRTVSLGERYQNFYVVRGVLEPGERVIVEGQQHVRPGMRVTPTAQPAAAENSPGQKGGD